MGKIAFIYPGQGAQKVGMGKDFYEKGMFSKAVYDRAEEILDFSVKEVCFEENERINSTAYTQAALVTTCLAMTAELTAAGVTPDATAGLSLGEYAAIAVAKGMSFEDAILLVRKRGIYMSEAVPDGVGGMAAVLGLTKEEVEAALEGLSDVSIANYNCPGQIVITGMKDAVIAAQEPLKERGAKRVLPLNVSGPFHSPFLKRAGEQLGKELARVSLKPLEIPYVTNVTARYVTDISETKELLERQVSTSVCWEQSMELLIQDGFDIFVEIGPGKTLNGFMRKINRDIKVYNVSVFEDVEKLLKSLR